MKGVSDFTVYHPTKPSNQTSVTVLKVCEHRDLAILGHSIHSTDYFKLSAASNTVEVGQTATAYGYPGYGPGDRINVRSGTISSLPIKSAVQMIEVTQELAQGMSGGPILDANGEVIGIIHKGGPHEGRQLAIQIGVLQTWIQE